MEASIAVLFWSDNGIKVTIVNRSWPSWTYMEGHFKLCLLFKLSIKMLLNFGQIIRFLAFL